MAPILEPVVNPYIFSEGMRSRLGQSFSRVELVLSLRTRGEAQAEIFRHLSPMTVNVILRNLPIQGRVARHQDLFVYVPTNLVVGVEKGRKEFRTAEISYFALNSSICVFLKDAKVGRPMNPLGKVTSGFELLQSANSGDVLTITLMRK